ncbi:hypothetical protein TanjilG_16119 [Lupinus angustifolius]|uniref:Uncharacterized protein n=1 Tax=Lupinus angustifolius TaxID=3871 RepID=A0A1J7HGT2_LUPAN|nr:hypothetical protein TanjilG_16119 [Lupinus angustifolius]
MKTLPSNAWLQRLAHLITFRDIGFLHWVADTSIYARGCWGAWWLPSWTWWYRYAALANDDLLFLKEQMEAEEDA